MRLITYHVGTNYRLDSLRPQSFLAYALGCRNEETGAAHTEDLAGRDQGVYNTLRYLSVRLRQKILCRARDKMIIYVTVNQPENQILVR